VFVARVPDADDMATSHSPHTHNATVANPALSRVSTRTRRNSAIVNPSVNALPSS
jgi:hypothetical protein